MTGKGRMELKHAISKADYYVLKNKLRYLMPLDKNAKNDGKYLIRSVYFDNFDNKILTEKKEGYYKRAKFRVRLYDHQRDYINLEKKSKRDYMTFKEKCRISAKEYERIRCGDYQWLEDDSRPLMRELYVQMKLYQLKPITIVDYTREAYIYPYGNVRVTFDSSIKTSFRNNDLLNPKINMVPALEPNLVILEVKYDQYLPDFIKYSLQMMDRRRDAYSKYQLSRMYG
ncbi:polyphosphate polymerase domain-containing protein [Peptococcaceae bacterium 1198_IL3148]